MRVIFVHEDQRGYGQGGGAETLLRSQMQALEMRGHQIHWYWGEGRFDAVMAEQQPDVVHVSTVHTQLGFGPVRWLQARRYPHVWALMDYWPFCRGRMLLKHYDEGCVAVEGICDGRCDEGPVDHRALVNGSPIVALNEYSAAIYRRNGLRCDYVLPLGVDHEYFVPAPERRVAGRTLTMSAWPSFATKGMHILRAAALEARVPVGLITGQPRERVRDILQTAEAFVFPSTYEETWGLCLTEALSTGLACIASNVCGPRAQIVDGENGLLVPPRDPAALADALRRVAGDAALRRRLGEAARASVEARMTLAHLGERLEAIYREL